MPILRVALYFLWPDYRGNTQAFIPPGGDLILLGCITALAREVPVLNSMVGRLASGPVAACAFVFLAVIQPWLSLLRGAYTLVVMPLVGGVAIVAVLSWALRSTGGRITGFLNHRLVVRLGVISYSVYIWQQNVSELFQHDVDGSVPVGVDCGPSCRRAILPIHRDASAEVGERAARSVSEVRLGGLRGSPCSVGSLGGGMLAEGYSVRTRRE
jgi:peptidoglycan/LPS O-acetylase OafA/YrhL